MSPKRQTLRFRPTGDRILVEPAAPETVTASGIHIPANVERPQVGTVLAIGPGGRNADGEWVPVNLEIGNRVYYSNYGGTPIELESTTFLLLREADVLGVLDGE